MEKNERQALNEVPGREMRIGFRKTGKWKPINDKDVIVDNSVEIGDISGSKSENTLNSKKKAEMHVLTAGCTTKMSETARDGGEFSFFLHCR